MNKFSKKECRIVAVVLIILLIMSLALNALFIAMRLIHGRETQEEDTLVHSGRWKESVGNTSLAFPETFADTITRYYYVTLPFEAFSEVTALFKEIVPSRDVNDVRVKYESVIDALKEDVTHFDLFTKLEEIDNGIAGVRLQAISEDSCNAFNAYYNVDGSFQATYYIRWGDEVGPTPAPDDIAKNIETYTGLKVTGNDIKKLQKEIMDIATPSSSCVFSVCDSNSLNYVTVSVSNFGTNAEMWAAYSSYTIQYTKE